MVAYSDDFLCRSNGIPVPSNSNLVIFYDTLIKFCDTVKPFYDSDDFSNILCQSNDVL